MRSGGCFQLVIQAVYVDTISCRLFHFWVERELEQYHFWTTANGNTSFSVMKDGDVLAECDIEAGVCEFALP